MTCVHEYKIGERLIIDGVERTVWAFMEIENICRQCGRREVLVQFEPLEPAQ